MADLSLVDDWLRFSEDKPWTPAWVFAEQDDGRWIVTYAAERWKTGYRITFASSAAACALMVRMEMEELRLSESK